MAGPISLQNAQALTDLAASSTAEGERALERIYLGHGWAVLGFASVVTGHSSVAEQVTEDVFVQLWEQRRILGVSQSLRSYLITEAHRRCLALVTPAGEESGELDPFDGSRIGGDPNGSAGPHRPHPVFERLAQLPLQQRLTIALAHFGEMTCAEMAAVLGVAEDTVVRQMYEGMGELADHQV